jgi:hypothetical protein
MRLVVGVADVLSRQIAYRLLAPALGYPSVRVICREARPILLAALASTRSTWCSTHRCRHRPRQGVRHLLGETT